MDEVFRIDNNGQKVTNIGQRIKKNSSHKKLRINSECWDSEIYQKMINAKRIRKNILRIEKEWKK